MVNPRVAHYVFVPVLVLEGLMVVVAQDDRTDWIVGLLLTLMAYGVVGWVLAECALRGVRRAEEA